MKMNDLSKIKTADEARTIAIEWQNWQGSVDMSYSEAIYWYTYFKALAKKFKLQNEFKENGII